LTLKVTGVTEKLCGSWPLVLPQRPAVDFAEDTSFPKFRRASDISHALASSVIDQGEDTIIERSHRAVGHGALDAAVG